MAPALELADIQGIVAAGYGHLPVASFVLLRAGNTSAAKAWLSGIIDRITTAQQRDEQQSVNVAFTHDGLKAFGLSNSTAGGFSAQFVAGMAEPSRSRHLGDAGPSAPEHWAWGGPTTAAIDVLLMLYGRDDETLEQLYRTLADGFAASQVVEVLRLRSAHLAESEPFGFGDGISQPLIEGVGPAGRAADTVKAGEFVLGHRNEYGQYPVSPMVADVETGSGLLPRGPGGHGRDFGRNGTYLIFRELRQDVDGFLAYLDQATRRPDGTSDQAAATRLAAKLIGRWPSGAPVVLTPDGDDPNLATANDFGYFHEDPDGRRCPIGAHIRRANPRDSLPPNPGSSESVAIGKRHRIIRRGRERSRDLAAAASTPDRGLHFICLNANIARQFEFIQGTWCNNPKFDGLYDEPDPILATWPDHAFRVPEDPVRRRYTGLPSFVSVVGGAYFFLPGIRALRFLAGRP
jgi:Dyp-type peroxidase family